MVKGQSVQTGTAERLTTAPAGAAVGIVALATGLVWAGTHELARVYSDRPDFSSSRWMMSLALLAAAGFVFANVLRPVDVRKKIDWSRVSGIVIIPFVILVYCWISLEFQYDNVVFDTLLAWASPFGHAVLAAFIGIGVTAGMQTRG